MLEFKSYHCRDFTVHPVEVIQFLLDIYSYNYKNLIFRMNQKEVIGRYTLYGGSVLNEENFLKLVV